MKNKKKMYVFLKRKKKKKKKKMYSHFFRPDIKQTRISVVQKKL